jgi:hypothetical protein
MILLQLLCFHAQGFQDIAITLLLVLGEEKSYSVLCRLVQSHFQLFMGPDMEPAIEILNLVYALVKNENRDLYNYLMRHLKPLPPPLKKKRKIIFKI